MPYGAHETMEVHEILNEKINLINHFSLYSQQVQDRQIRQMIDRHLQTAVQSYDQLVSYTHDYSAAVGLQRPYGMPGIQPQNIQYGLHDPAQQAPQTQGRLNDQQILMAVLSCHKNSARNQMHSSLECADPNIRQMLINGAITCANQAYEVFVFMNQQGYYQVPTMNDHTAKTYLHAYQPMNESPAMGMNMMGQTQTGGTRELGQMGSFTNNLNASMTGHMAPIGNLHNTGGGNLQQ